MLSGRGGASGSTVLHVDRLLSSQDSLGKTGLHLRGRSVGCRWKDSCLHFQLHFVGRYVFPHTVPCGPHDCSFAVSFEIGKCEPSNFSRLLWLLGSLAFPMEKAMAPHSSTLAWKIPWTEEPGRLQSMGSLGVGHE